MQDRTKKTNFLFAGLAVIAVVAGTIFYQMTQDGQPTPPENTPIAAQGR